MAHVRHPPRLHTTMGSPGCSASRGLRTRERLVAMLLQPSSTKAFPPLDFAGSFVEQARHALRSYAGRSMSPPPIQDMVRSGALVLLLSGAGPWPNAPIAMGLALSANFLTVLSGLGSGVRLLQATVCGLSPSQRSHHSTAVPPL